MKLKVQPEIGPERAFGQDLREIRRSREISQEALGLEASFDRTYISLIERGINSPTDRDCAALVFFEAAGFYKSKLFSKGFLEFLQHMNERFLRAGPRFGPRRDSNAALTRSRSSIKSAKICSHVIIPDHIKQADPSIRSCQK